MTRQTRPPKECLLVAVDAAKRFHDILVQWPDARTAAFRVPNTRQGFGKLCAFLQRQRLPVRVALEATADFHRPIAYALAEAGFEVHLASSLACARIREALYNSWDKHDRKDARVILHLLEQGLTRPFHDPLRTGVERHPTLRLRRHPVSRTFPWGASPGKPPRRGPPEGRVAPWPSCPGRRV